MTFARLAARLPAFSAAFGVLYVLCLYFNVAAFTFYPENNEFHIHALRDAQGPAMYFYGWLFNAFVGAAIVLAASMLVPEKIAAKVWSGWSWLLPLAAIVAAAWFTRIWFV